MKRNNIKKKKYGLGITGRLVLCFTCFVVFLLVIIWVFLILLLTAFYHVTKENELDSAAASIAAKIESESLYETAYDCAVKYHLCVRIFGTDGETFTDELCTVENSQICLIHHMPPDVLEMYYAKAVAAGGIYTEEIKPVSNSYGDSDNIFSGDESEENIQTSKRKDSRNTVTQIQIFTARVIESGGNTYILFLDTEYSPLLSTKTTLNLQFWRISVGVVFIAALLAIIFAQTVSRPLVRMAATADKMAAGDYTPDFPVEGYRETKMLAEALNYAATEISKSDSIKKELIANVSHDLRTPLTMIAGYAEVMRDIPGESTPENVQVIIDESNRLSSLVNDMLDLSKIEAGTKTAQKELFNLTETVEEVMGRYSALIMHDGYSVSFTHDGNASVYADRTMMLQVVYNLINNAINYTGEDKKVFVSQCISDDGKRVRINVRDTGEGIAKENIPLIWDRYYKVDKLHRRACVGSGLGLSIVRNILQLHGASYGVESSEGNGSVFWFEMDISG